MHLSDSQAAHPLNLETPTPDNKVSFEGVILYRK